MRESSREPTAPTGETASVRPRDVEPSSRSTTSGTTAGSTNRCTSTSREESGAARRSERRPRPFVPLGSASGPAPTVRQDARARDRQLHRDRTDETDLRWTDKSRTSRRCGRRNVRSASATFWSTRSRLGARSAAARSTRSGCTSTSGRTRSGRPREAETPAESKPCPSPPGGVIYLRGRPSRPVSSVPPPRSPRGAAP
jgi:hypothetical protein